MSLSYTSNQIKLNHPNKVLGVSVTSIEGTEYWPFANATDDPWYEQGTSPRYYRWRVTFSVTEANHGSNLTRDDYKYNGLDILVNDWIAGATDGKCLKIISVESKTKTSVTCIIEDWLRYNTFKATNGNGVFNLGSAVVFTLNENGIPMLDPLPSSVSNDFFPLVFSRFQYLNPQINYVLEKANHGFSKGDVVSVTSNGFVKANASTADSMVGVVTESGPGPNYFMLLPNNRIIDFDPAIPGVQGEKIYVEVDGSLSNVSTATNRIAFINLQSASPTVLQGTQGDPTITSGYVISINDNDITLTGSGPNTTLTEIVDLINNETANTSVIASTSPLETVISSSSAGTAYGLVGGYVPFSAKINGVTVNFTTSGSQYVNVSTPEDMAIDINGASIPNLVASATATVLTLTETSGGNIEIQNLSPDANSNFFVGFSNISGLPATTVGSNSNKLILTRNDGGEILIYEDSDLFQLSTGVYSGQNGALPLAINIEQGIRTGGVTVVADIASRDSLYSIAGDQAYVVDTGLGEWGLYLYTGSNWVQVANQDSSTVDARTLVTTFTAPIAGGGTSTVQNLGSISPGRKISTISVEVGNVFVSGTPATIEVGTAADPDKFFTVTESDLSTVEEFIIMPEYVHPATATSELVVQARLNHYNASQGIVTIKVTYL